MKSHRTLLSVPLLSVSLLSVLLMVLVFVSTAAWGQGTRVITFGNDLTTSQKENMLKIFGVTAPQTVTQQQITIDEERHYLAGLVPDQVIGNKSISSVSVELLPAGQGINTQTHNITWVTAEMYANALATAGVKDAKIIAAAPYPVSGTAALAGVMKAFETASGTRLSEERKKVASEELVRTGELGQQLQNKDQAAKLMMLIKEQVVKQGLTDPEKIKPVVTQIADQLQINLTPEQISSIVDLMVRLSRTNVNMDELSTQLAGLRQKLDTLVSKSEEASSFLERIWTALNDFFTAIMEKINSIFK